MAYTQEYYPTGAEPRIFQYLRIWYNKSNKNLEKFMGHFLEKFGLRKNPEKIKQQEAIRGMEKYLQETIAQYKMNQCRLQNMPETFFGQGHQEDTKDIGAAQNSLEGLKITIIETAQKLGKDGNKIISEADEDIRRIQERSKVA